MVNSELRWASTTSADDKELKERVPQARHTVSSKLQNPGDGIYEHKFKEIAQGL